MIIEVYGKLDCQLCESAKKKVAHFLQKWELHNSIRMVFQDIETVDGAAEGDFHDVFDIPSVLLKHPDTGAVIARWDGQAPPTDELRERLCA